MKLLEKTFIKNCDKSGNHRFTLVRNTDNIYLYKREHLDGVLVGHEVFISKQILKGSKLPNGAVEKNDRWQYPGTACWGKTAWSPVSLDAAEERFDKLVAASKSQGDVPKRRGRKSTTPKEISLPKDTFTMRNLMEHTGLSQPILYLRLQELIKNGKVIEVDRVKSPSGKGRATCVYRPVAA